MIPGDGLVRGPSPVRQVAASLAPVPAVVRGALPAGARQAPALAAGWQRPRYAGLDAARSSHHRIAAIAYRAGTSPMRFARSA